MTTGLGAGCFLTMSESLGWAKDPRPDSLRRLTQPPVTLWSASTQQATVFYKPESAGELRPGDNCSARCSAFKS